MSKKILFITLTAIVLWCFAYSCAKQNDYDGYVETTTERFSTVDEQVAYLEGLLATLDAEKVVLADYADSLAGAGDARAEVVDSLLEDLDGKMQVVEDTLKQYATKTWADATFATLKIVDSLSTVTTELKEMVKEDSTAIAGDIEKSIKASEDSLKKMFESYYTRAEVDAKIGTLTARLHVLDSTADAVKDSVGTLEKEVAALHTKYGEISAALDTAINKLKKQDTLFMSEIERIDTTFSSRFDSLGDVVAANKAKLDELTGRIAKLEARVQSVEVVPDYIDGSVKMTKYSTAIKFEVRPVSAAKALVAKGVSAFSLQAMKVKAVTKASIYTTITVQSASIDAQDSLLVLKVKGSDMPADFFDTTAAHQCYSARLSINDGNTGKSTPYFPLTYATPSYPEAPGLKSVEINGIVWAPVNCGYDATNYKYGKLYQWGRKNGCGYKAKDGTSSYNDNGALLQTEKSGPVSASNEDDAKFYSVSKTPYDWLTSKNDVRWNSGTESSPVKTQYDPCPEGWRLPTYAELNALTGNSASSGIGEAGWDSINMGYWFNGTKTPKCGEGVFFSASGYRTYDIAYAYERGSRGFYWSSSVNDIRARCLICSNVSASMSSNYRADGYSVRCVME